MVHKELSVDTCRSIAICVGDQYGALHFKGDQWVSGRGLALRQSSVRVGMREGCCQRGSDKNAQEEEPVPIVIVGLIRHGVSEQ